MNLARQFCTKATPIKPLEGRMIKGAIRDKHSTSDAGICTPASVGDFLRLGLSGRALLGYSTPLTGVKCDDVASVPRVV